MDSIGELYCIQLGSDTWAIGAQSNFDMIQEWWFSQVTIKTDSNTFKTNQAVTRSNIWTPIFHDMPFLLREAVNFWWLIRILNLVSITVGNSYAFSWFFSHPFAPYSAPPRTLARTHSIASKFCVYTDFLQ